MKAWELIKALQEGKSISNINYKNGRFIRLKDVNEIELVFEDGTPVGLLHAYLRLDSYKDSYSYLEGHESENWKIKESKHTNECKIIRICD